MEDWNYNVASTTAKINTFNAGNKGKGPSFGEHDAVRRKMRETREKRASEAWREFWC